MACEHISSHSEHSCGVPQFEENQLSHVKHVVGVVSGKGGVGKSMVTGVLAAELSRRGYKVGILDADITGPSIPRMFGKAHDHLETLGNLILPSITDSGLKIISANLMLQHEDDPVLWRGPVLAGAIRQFWSQTSWGEIDYLLVDMPPGTGDVALTVFQSLPCEGVILVASPQDLVQMIVGKAVKMASKMNIPILGIVENMSYVTCPDCGCKIELFGPSHIQETCDAYKLDLLGSMPIDPKLAQACDAGQLEQKLPDELLPGAIDAILQLDGTLPKKLQPSCSAQKQASCPHKGAGCPSNCHH